MVAKWQRERLYGLPVEEERHLLRWAFLEAVGRARPSLLEAFTAIGERAADLVADDDRVPSSTWTPEEWEDYGKDFCWRVELVIQPTAIQHLLQTKT